MVQEENMRFESDVLMENEYLRINLSCSLGPEKSLMLAVLEDAIACYQKYYRCTDTKEKAAFSDAESWLVSSESDWSFSFVNICEALGLSPGYIRKGLANWAENQGADTT